MLSNYDQIMSDLQSKYTEILEKFCFFQIFEEEEAKTEKTNIQNYICFAISKYQDITKQIERSNVSITQEQLEAILKKNKLTTEDIKEFFVQEFEKVQHEYSCILKNVAENAVKEIVDELTQFYYVNLGDRYYVFNLIKMKQQLRQLLDKYAAFEVPYQLKVLKEATFIIPETTEQQVFLLQNIAEAILRLYNDILKETDDAIILKGLDFLAEIAANFFKRYDDFLYDDLEKIKKK